MGQLALFDKTGTAGPPIRRAYSARRGSVATVSNREQAAGGDARNTSRGLPWSMMAPKASGATMPPRLKAGGDEAEHLAERAGRGHLAHDHVARRHHEAEAETGERHHQHQRAGAEID